MEIDQTKLTLRLNAEVIKKAKNMALKRGTSVSKMVQEYFELLATTDRDTNGEQEALGERTKFIKGILNKTNTHVS